MTRTHRERRRALDHEAQLAWSWPARWPVHGLDPNADPTGDREVAAVRCVGLDLQHAAGHDEGWGLTGRPRLRRDNHGHQNDEKRERPPGHALHHSSALDAQLRAATSR